MQHYFNCMMTVHRRFIKRDELPFENVAPQELLIAIGHKGRRAVYREAVERGFSVKGYISKQAINSGYIAKDAIVFEWNNIQPHAIIGRNTVLWSGNHIGHHASIANHCFITSHVCIGGGAMIGDGCFVGMNATVFDHVKIGDNCIIAAGAVVDRDIPDNHTMSRKGVLVENR